MLAQIFAATIIAVSLVPALAAQEPSQLKAAVWQPFGSFRPSAIRAFFCPLTNTLTFDNTPSYCRMT